MGSAGVLQRSIFKKVFSAFTGLFLCLFLLGHLAGNLQLLYETFGYSTADAQKAFNGYADFMTSNPAIKIMSYVTYLSILFHAVLGLYLERQNRIARGVAYSKNNAGANSMWASRNMGVLGVLILVFLVLHLKSFWYEMHFGGLVKDSNGFTDLYSVVVAAYTQWWYVLIYVVSMALLGFHLLHGFQSAFQSIGLNHPTYTPIIKKTGLAFAILIPLLFAVIPVAMYITANFK